MDTRNQVVLTSPAEPSSMSHIKSRYGYHVCDYATYQKLRLLNYLIMCTKHRAGAQCRFDRKTKFQGTVRERVFMTDEHGKRKPCGWRTVREDAPRPNSPVGYVRVPKSYNVRARQRGGRDYTIGLGDDFANFEALYRSARKPSEVPAKPLTNSDVVPAMAALDRLKSWYETNAPKKIAAFKIRAA